MGTETPHLMFYSPIIYNHVQTFPFPNSPTYSAHEEYSSIPTALKPVGTFISAELPKHFRPAEPKPGVITRAKQLNIITPMQSSTRMHLRV